MGWFTFLKRAADSVPTPAAGKVALFVDATAGVPTIKTESGTVVALGGGANLSATADGATVTVASDTGTDAAIPAATGATAGVMAAADKAKLDGVASGATNTPLTDAAAAALGAAGAGAATAAARADHVHPMPGAADVGAIPAAEKGAADGVAPLGSDNKVPSAYLPSYMDEVVEYADTGAFPTTGTAGIIYVALDSGKIYRWSGSAYVEISPSPGSTDAVPEGATNLYFSAARAKAAAVANAIVAGVTDVAPSQDAVKAGLDGKAASTHSHSATAIAEPVVALSIASGVVNVDLSLGNLFTLLLTENVTSITYSNMPASGFGKAIAIRIRQDTTGGRTVALPSSLKASGGTDTSVASAANAYTLLTLMTFDQGTRWEYAMQDLAA